MVLNPPSKRGYEGHKKDAIRVPSTLEELARKRKKKRKIEAELALGI
jgi:hypothetical protein